MAVLAERVNDAGGSVLTNAFYFESKLSLFSTVVPEMGKTVGGTVFGALLPQWAKEFARDAGKLGAVLSSEDGAPGDLLACRCGHYLAIAYSTLLCFLLVGGGESPGALRA